MYKEGLRERRTEQKERKKVSDGVKVWEKGEEKRCDNDNKMRNGREIMREDYKETHPQGALFVLRKTEN